MKVSRRGTLDRYYVLSLSRFAVFVHRIHHSDPPGSMHTHPWSWLSLIFGSYVEERPGKKPRRRWLLNWCRAGQPHRVTIARPVWTVLVHARRRCKWAVTDDAGNVLEVEPWTGTENPERKQYLEAA